MTYELVIQSKAKKDLGRIQANDRQIIIESLHKLAKDPYSSSSVKKLQGSDYYRLRVGNYRVVYEIQNEQLIVLVMAIGHRKDIYRGRL